MREPARRRKPKAGKYILWIAAGAAAYGLHLIVGRDSLLAENLFGRGVFAAFRWTWDYTLGLSPIPLIYLVFVGASAFFIWKYFRRRSVPRTEPDRRFWKKLVRFELAAAAWAGWFVLFFYVLWGYNYNRPGIEKILHLETSPLEAAEVAAETEWAVKMAADSRIVIPGVAPGSELTAGLLPENLESEIRASLTRVLRGLGYPSPGRVRIRMFDPGGWMMRFSGSGIYLPYFGEGYIPRNLSPAEKPFTMAHEMAHGYGITDEGDANFLALLACETSARPVVRYSGYLSYWNYAAGELGRADRPALKALGSLVPDGMRADLLAIRKNWEKYEGPLAKISEKVYGQYLKSQGIKEGMKSYSRFLNLRAAWRKKSGA